VRPTGRTLPAPVARARRAQPCFWALGRPGPRLRRARWAYAELRDGARCVLERARPPSAAAFRAWPAPVRLNSVLMPGVLWARARVQPKRSYRSGRAGGRLPTARVETAFRPSLVPRSAVRTADPGTGVDKVSSRGPGGPRIRCPKCNWSPRAWNRWMCICRHVWNTFDTGGICPACLYQWRVTACLRCTEWSPHSDWYAQE
jgi:hypothetical protein